MPSVLKVKTNVTTLRACQLLFDHIAFWCGLFQLCFNLRKTKTHKAYLI